MECSGNGSCTIRNIVWEEIAELVDPIRCGPRFVSMSVQAMNGDNIREI